MWGQHASFTKLRENDADSCISKRIKGRNKNRNIFGHGEKQENHRKLPKFQLFLHLFHVGKQHSQNEATYLEMGFPKIMMKK